MTAKIGSSAWNPNRRWMFGVAVGAAVFVLGLGAVATTASQEEQEDLPSYVVREFTEGEHRWEIRAEPNTKCLDVKVTTLIESEPLAGFGACGLADAVFDGGAIRATSKRTDIRPIAGVPNLAPSGKQPVHHTIVTGVAPCDCIIRGFFANGIVTDSPVNGVFLLRSPGSTPISRLEALNHENSIVADYVFPESVLKILFDHPSNDLSG